MHNFKGKRILRVVLVCLICAVILVLLDLMLYPCTFMRNDIHTVSTQAFDDIILGTSHGKMNIDPETMETVTGRTGHNVCVGGEYGVDAYYIARLINEKQSVDRIIYEVDPGYFVSEKEEGNNYLLFYHEFPLSMAKLGYFRDSVAKCNFRTVFFPWYEYSLSYEVPRIATTFTRKVTGDYNIESLKTASQEYHESGFIERYAVDTSELKMKPIKLFDKAEVSEETMEYLEKLIRYCKKEGIDFVAVTTPMPGATLSKYQDQFFDAWDFFNAFFEEQGVDYINFNEDYYNSFSHDITCFTDYDGHMNGDAAREFSGVLGEILNRRES